MFDISEKFITPPLVPKIKPRKKSAKWATDMTCSNVGYMFLYTESQARRTYSSKQNIPQNCS
jgi:hypothetical protein